jgi:hypothetical protein
LSWIDFGAVDEGSGIDEKAIEENKTVDLVRLLLCKKKTYRGDLQHDREDGDLLSSAIRLWHVDKFCNHGCFDNEGHEDTRKAYEKSLG